MDKKEYDDLVERLDGRYKLREDCDRDMDEVNKAIHKQDVDVALIMQQLAIIKWITATTLGAALAALVGLVISRFAGG